MRKRCRSRSLPRPALLSARMGMGGRLPLPDEKRAPPGRERNVSLGETSLAKGEGGGGGGGVSLSPGEKTAGLLHEKSALGAETQAPAQRERGMHMARALLYCAQLAYLFTENELICSCLFAQIE